MRRRLLLLLVFPLLLLAAAWAGAWFWAAASLEHSLQRWRLEQAAAGREVRFREMEIGGFPLRLKVRITAPQILDERGWRWAGPSISGSAAVWAPNRLTLSFPGRHRLTSGRSILLLAAAQATAEARLDRRGRITAWQIELQGLEAAWPESQEPFATAERLELEAGALEEEDAPGHPFRLLTRAVFLPPEFASPLGREIAELALVGRITGPLPHALEEDALEIWRAAHGTLEIQEIRLSYGPLLLTGEGRAGLDEALRPEGSLLARIAGLPETIDALAAAGLLTPASALALKFGALAAAGEQDAEGRALVVLPITAADGMLFLGPVKLLPLKPLV